MSKSFWGEQASRTLRAPPEKAPHARRSGGWSSSGRPIAAHVNSAWLLHLRVVDTVDNSLLWAHPMLYRAASSLLTLQSRDTRSTPSTPEAGLSKLSSHISVCPLKTG